MMLKKDQWLNSYGALDRPPWTSKRWRLSKDDLDTAIARLASAIGGSNTRPCFTMRRDGDPVTVKAAEVEGFLDG